MGAWPGALLHLRPAWVRVFSLRDVAFPVKLVDELPVRVSFAEAGPNPTVAGDVVWCRWDKSRRGSWHAIARGEM